MNPTNDFKQGYPHTAAFGITGAGKTTLKKRLIAKSKRLVVWDPMGDIAEHNGKAGSIRPVDKAGLLKAFKSAYAGHRNLRVAFQVERENRADIFEIFCQNIISFQMEYPRHGKKLDLVIDEIDAVYGRHVSNEHPFAEIVRRGRHFGINIIGGTQFPTTVNPDFRRNCSISYLFPLGAEGPAFVQSAYKNKQAAEMMQILPNHHAIVLETGAQEPWIYKNPPLKKR